MADLKTGASSYPTTKDTFTPYVDHTDNAAAANVNNILSAVVALENELGVAGTGITGLKGTMASLAERLTRIVSAGGSIPSGTSFPSSPTPQTGDPFIRTDYTPSQFYFYDKDSTWRRFDSIYDHGILTGLGDDDHTQYVHLSSARAITANHSFSPASPGVPFTLASNAQNQKVVGLRVEQADALLGDGSYRTVATANTANTIVRRDASGNFSAGTVTASVTGNVTGNVTGSSGSCTGNSATATTASGLSMAGSTYGYHDTGGVGDWTPSAGIYIISLSNYTAGDHSISVWDGSSWTGGGDFSGGVFITDGSYMRIHSYSASNIRFNYRKITGIY